MWCSRFLPWTAVFNINLGNSSDPAVEKRVLSTVASYGRQLGRIGDALEVILRAYRPARELTAKEADAIEELLSMLREIRKVKAKYGRAGDTVGMKQGSESQPILIDSGAVSRVLPAGTGG
jgi:hypothetical protein